MTPTLTLTPRDVLQSGRDDLMRQLVDRARALAGIDAGVRRDAVHRELEIAAPLAAGLHRAAGQRGFEHEHRVAPSRFRLDVGRDVGCQFPRPS